MNPTSYLGVRPLNPGNIFFRNRDPNNLQDVNNYQPGDTWMNPVLNRIWMLMRDFNVVGGGKQAVWVQITGGGGGSGIQNLKGDVGDVVGPVGGLCLIDGDPVAGVITTGIIPNEITISVENATAGVDVAHAQKGVSCFNSADFTVVGGFVSSTGGTGNMDSLTTDDGHVVLPDGAGNINVLTTANQGLNTIGNLAGHTVTINAANATAGTALTATKGVASFNSTNFTVVNGFVSAIAGAAGILTVKGNDNVVVGPDITGNLKILGDTTQGIEVDGVALTNTSTITAYNATNGGGKGVSTYTASQFNVAAGQVSLTGNIPDKPMMKAYRNATTGGVTGDNTVYQIVFDNVLYDTKSNYNNTTGVFKASQAGVYAVTAHVTANNIDNTHFLSGCYIILNGAGLIMQQSNPYPGIYDLLAQHSNYWNLSTQCYLNVNDTLSVLINIAGGVKNVTVYGTPEYTSFCVSLIG